MIDVQSNYIKFISELKQDIQGARTQTILVVNRQLLLLYWRIGNRILKQQRIEGWGTKVIDKISNDLKVNFQT